MNKTSGAPSAADITRFALEQNLTIAEAAVRLGFPREAADAIAAAAASVPVEDGSDVSVVEFGDGVWAANDSGNYHVGWPSSDNDDTVDLDRAREFIVLLTRAVDAAERLNET